MNVYILRTTEGDYVKRIQDNRAQTTVLKSEAFYEQSIEDAEIIASHFDCEVIPYTRNSESAFDGSVMEGQPRRYTILNEQDIKTYLPEELQEKLDDVLSEVLETIEEGRFEDGKKPYNSYIVNNTDEPYIGEIVDVMKKHGKWDEK